jgi:hypothetical protein
MGLECEYTGFRTRGGLTSTARERVHRGMHRGQSFARSDLGSGLDADLMLLSANHAVESMDAAYTLEAIPAASGSSFRQVAYRDFDALSVSGQGGSESVRSKVCVWFPFFEAMRMLTTLKGSTAIPIAHIGGDIPQRSREQTYGRDRRALGQPLTPPASAHLPETTPPVPV